MPNVAYGCVFCITGKENIVAECIERRAPACGLPRLAR